MRALVSALQKYLKYPQQTGSSRNQIQTRARRMLGFKNFESAAITIAGIELLRRICKGQFALGRLRLNDQTAPAT